MPIIKSSGVMNTKTSKEGDDVFNHSQTSVNSLSQKGRPSVSTSRPRSQGKAADDNIYQSLDADPPSQCKLCPDLVYGDGIQCDNCLAWVHCPGHKSNCCRLSKKEFTSLRQAPESVKWWCSVCENEGKEQSGSMNNKLAEHSAILSDLRAIIKTLQQQNEIILDMLKNKSEPTESMVKIHVEQALENMQEKENRKNNIILYNVDESKKKGQEGEIEDEKLTREIINYVQPELDGAPINIRIIRLGKPRDMTKADAKPRPIKVNFDHSGIALSLLRKAYRLKDFRLRKVGLSADKTKLQREAEKSTREEYKRRKENKEDVCMFRGKVMTREERDRIRENYYYDDTSDMPALEGDEESGLGTAAAAAGISHGGQ